MAEKFSTRSHAARHAAFKGLKAFRTELVSGTKLWKYFVMEMGPGIEYALDYAEGKAWISHVEITDRKVPVLVVTCFKHELPQDIPELFEVEPITNELWNPGREQKMIHVPPGTAPATAQRPRAEKQPRSSGGRKGGAKAVCTEVFLSNPNMPKAEYVEKCLERGIFKGTAAARYTDIIRAYEAGTLN